MEVKTITCPFEVGDVLKCIHFGGNNTDVAYFNCTNKGDKNLIVKKIHTASSKYVWKLDNGNTIFTIETECGKFLWASTRYYKVVKKARSLENPNYSIF